MAKTPGQSQRLGWRMAWRFAGKISFEVLFSSSLAMGFGALRSIESRIDRARRNARLNKFGVSAFIALLAASFGAIIWSILHGFFAVDPALAWIMIAIMVSVFALICFGFLVFWGVMISTNFISTSAASIGLYLPLSRADAGRLSLLSYIRLFDAQLIAIMVAFPSAYFAATFSVLGALVCLGLFLITAGLAITVMLLLALFFYSRIQAVGGSPVRSVVRLVFTLLWATAIMTFSVSLQFMPLLLNAIQSFATFLQPNWNLLGLLYPFALGTLVVQASGISGQPMLWYVPLAALLYAILAYLGVRWSANLLTKVGLAGVVQTSPSVVRPVTVRVGRAGVAMIRKDIRVALRTPAQSVMLFMPILTMLPVLIAFFQNTGALRVADLLVLVTTPTMFLSVNAIFFLGFETRGMAYTLTLPLKAETVLRAKTRLITCMSVSIPVIAVVVSFFRPLTTPISLAIAASQCAVVYASSMIALVLFTRFMGGGRLVGFDITQDIIQSFVVGGISTSFAVIPASCYVAGWMVAVTLFSFAVADAHLVALAAMWIGIAFNYLLGRVMARSMLRG
jgi:predicted permease